jgi:hypothetical protein
METIHIVDKEFSNLTGGVGVSQRHEMGVFGEFIDDDQQAVELARRRQAIDKVHRSHFLGSRRNWQRLE